MPKHINDQFSNLPISRQRKYQLRQVALGKCQICGKDKHQNSVFCGNHLLQHRLRQRRLKGYDEKRETGSGRPSICIGDEKE
jgi:hypothetical protein